MLYFKRFHSVFIIIAFAISINCSLAQKSSSVLKNELPAIVVVNIQRGDNVAESIVQKVDPAFALAMFASNKYRSISFAERDSVLTLLQKENHDVTASLLASHLGAQQIAFITINRLQNILRVSLACRYGPNYAELREGIGYALLKYRKGSEDSILYDPSLLIAIQRAFAAAQGDSMMYRKAEMDLRVYPAQLLAPTHLEIKQKVETTSLLFNPMQKPVVAYDAMQTIFLAAKDHPLYVPLDVDTRDSVYALANLYDVENANPPNVLELKVLYQLDIRQCIMSELTLETRDDIVLKMKFCEIMPDGNLRLLREEKTMLAGDKVSDLQKALAKTTRKLLRER